MNSDISSEEYDSDEPAPLVLDFKELTRRASIAVSRTCTRWRKLTTGRYHEIFVLFFRPDDDSHDETEDGDLFEREWSCIARVSREPENVEKLMSELETMQYVRSRTSIPVPEIYGYDFGLDNNVGAQFVLMERLPGHHLYRLWDKLTLNHKKVVLSDIAQVLVELSQLKFNRIGCLGSNDAIGPLLCRMGNGAGGERTYTTGPFDSTDDYLLSFLDAQSDGSDVFIEVKRVLEGYISTHGDSPRLVAPFRLIHADFDAQNILFTVDNPDHDDTPCISGVIDWEYAYAGPLYFLYEYPIFIQDSDDNKAAYEDNAILRQHFLRSLRQCFPKGSTGRYELDTSMEKNYTLNQFHGVLVQMAGGLGMRDLKLVAAQYVENVQDGTGNPYSGRIDYSSDEDVLTDEMNN